MAPTKFVALQITPEARAATRRMAALVTGEIEERVTYAQVLLIAEALMRAHRADVAQIARTVLSGEDPQDSE